MKPTPFFLPGAEGQRFCVYHPPATPQTRGAVLYLHPFAEEMNKSRRMARLQAQALAGAGYAVLQIDLLGCGDSDGDFGDAGWTAWLDDGRRATAWLREQTAAPLWLWGCRTGGLLAAQLAASLAEPPGLLLWNPTPSGKQAFRQFLRLLTAGEALAGGDRNAAENVRRSLADGQTIEIAGYRIAPALATGLEQASFDPPPRLAALRWLEVSPRDDPALPPTASAALAMWQAACPDIRSRAVRGPAFWQTVEIEDAPELIGATLELISGSR